MKAKATALLLADLGVTKSHSRLDQSANPEAPGPSLISRTGRLIVVATFRKRYMPHAHGGALEK
jgi:hypothetical protein